jgi:hypothetical protein
VRKSKDFLGTINKRAEKCEIKKGEREMMETKEDLLESIDVMREVMFNNLEEDGLITPVVILLMPCDVITIDAFWAFKDEESKMMFVEAVADMCRREGANVLLSVSEKFEANPGSVAETVLGDFGNSKTNESPEEFMEALEGIKRQVSMEIIHANGESKKWSRRFELRSGKIEYLSELEESIPEETLFKKWTN